MPVGKPKRNQPAELFETADKMRVMFSSGINKIMCTDVNIQFIRAFHVI
jgi:hypothetical protein